MKTPPPPNWRPLTGENLLEIVSPPQSRLPGEFYEK